jgi:hypothetical protein
MVWIVCVIHAFLIGANDYWKAGEMWNMMTLKLSTHIIYQ